MTKIQITKLRLNGEVSARYLQDNGNFIPDANPICARFPDAYENVVNVGSIWEVTGPVEERRIKLTAVTYYEDYIACETADLVQISTSLLKAWLEANIKNVGTITATRCANYPQFLEKVINEEFNELLGIRGLRVETLKEIARKLPSPDLIQTMDWFASHKIPVRIALNITDILQADAVEFVQSNPFVLCKFGVSFKAAHELANLFGFDDDSEIVKAAKALNIVETLSASTGSTMVTRREFDVECAKRSYDAPTALLRAAGAQRTLGIFDGNLIPETSYIIEHEVSSILLNLFNREDGAESELAKWETDITDRQIDYYIDSYQKQIPYQLTDNQKEAIHGCVRPKVSVISGGAGTGKTTILQGVLHVVQRLAADIEIIQLALSGRAAQRMSEATGKPASTIAKWCIDQKNTKPEQRPEHCLIIIDEASMVDVYTMHKLLNYVHPAARFIFVGDDQQLPPVGTGLVYHAMIDSDAFPQFNLKQVQRQSETSLIHKFATAIRNDEYLKLPDYKTNKDIDCSLTDTSEIPEIWTDLGPDTMILCATQKGATGVRNLNAEIQGRIGHHRPALQFYDDEEGLIDFTATVTGSKFRLDDPILITKNSYDIDVRNGDIGRVVEVYDEPDENGSSGVLMLNNRLLDIDFDLLLKMELAYAITIHKSQGSQWRNAIVVLDKSASRMLDKTLLYTAVTRATHKCVISCDIEEMLIDAATGGSIALGRNTALSKLLTSKKET